MRAAYVGLLLVLTACPAGLAPTAADDESAVSGKQPPARPSESTTPRCKQTATSPLTGGPPRAAPTDAVGPTTISGRLPPEMVQGPVRAHFACLRRCYERGLRLNPALMGRVSIAFVIARDGSVASARDAGSDLPAPAVVACIADELSGLRFPAPERGEVKVVYPILLVQ